MSAVAVQRSKPQVYELQAGTPQKLAQLAERRELSSSLLLQALVAEAFDGIVLGEPLDAKPFASVFIPRVLELARQETHPGKDVRTSYNMSEDYVDAIRKLREALELPRRDLVVEYLVQAAWDLRRDDPDGGGRKKRVPLIRGRRLASEHNVDQSAATVGGRLLVLNQLHLRGLEVPSPKKN